MPITRSTQALRRARLVGFPPSLGLDHLIQSPVRRCASKMCVLSLELCQPFHLVALQPAMLGQPARELTSVTPIDLVASVTVRPCRVTTCTCRNFATISRHVPSSPHQTVLLMARSHTQWRTTSQGADQRQRANKAFEQGSHLHIAKREFG